MTKDEAVAVLKTVTRRTIRSVYDWRLVAEAIFVLMPGFEYPDWDWRTVREFLDHVREVE
jgi:hypothetical protein